MYTNIPIQETLNIIEQQLGDLQNHPLEIKKTIKIITHFTKTKLFSIPR